MHVDKLPGKRTEVYRSWTLNLYLHGSRGKEVQGGATDARNSSHRPRRRVV